MRRTLFTAATLLALTSPALAADFDGDGIPDLALGSPELDNYTGQVTVLYGSAGAVRYGDRVGIWDQDRAGHPGSAVENARYGNALAEGDFDGDGYDDLAVGAPGESLSKGAVYVLRGSARGLTTTGAVRWDQDSPGIAGVAERGDHFGYALAAGDFNCDGYDDLAIGVPGEEISGQSDAGAVAVIYGSDQGLHRSRGQADALLHQDGPDIEGTAERGDRFGSTLVAGDIDGPFDPTVMPWVVPNCTDLVVGVLGEDGDAGAIQLFRGMGAMWYRPQFGTHPALWPLEPYPYAGLNGVHDTWLSQDSSGIKGTSDNNDRFGSSLAIGDFDDDGFGDVVVGIPGEDGEGAVAVIYGDAGGFSESDDLWYQDASGVLGAGEQGDEFGGAVAVGDIDHDGVDDLLVSVPGEDKWFAGSADALTGTWWSRGGVHVLFGVRGSGVTATGDILYQGPQYGHRFGELILVGDGDGDGDEDLLVTRSADPSADGQLWSHDFASGSSLSLCSVDGRNSRFLSASGGPNFPYLY